MADEFPADAVPPEGPDRDDALAAERAAHAATREALSLAEARLDAVLTGQAIWIWETDAEHRFSVFLGEQPLDCTTVLGRTRFENAADAHDAAKWDTHRADLDAHRAFEDFRYRTHREGPGPREIRVSGMPLFDGRGRFAGYRGIATDVTDTVLAQKRQKELRDEAERSRQRMRDAIETISDGFVLYDADDRLVMFNRRYQEEYSFAPEAMVPGTRFIDILRHGVAAGRVPIGYDADRWIEERMAAHRDPPPPYLVERSDGRWTLMTEYRTRDGGLVGIRTDVTELKQRERAAHENEQLMRELIDAVPALVQTKDRDLRYHLVNQYFLDVWDLGHDEIVGKTQEEAFQQNRSAYYGRHATDRDRWVLENKRATGMYEVSYPRADGRTLTLWAHKVPMLDEHGEVSRILTVGMDISGLKAAQKQIETQRDALHQSEKLTALGSLLAGVAHELNNPLSVVVGRAALLEDQVREPAIVASLTRIREAAERCGRIVKTFLAMARQRTPERHETRLNDVLGVALGLVDYGLRSDGVEVETLLGANLPAVEGDKDELVQVFSNLLINASQALAQIDTERCITVASYLSSDGMVTVDITDSGPGIPATVRDRIFEPFFSTKPEGSGTGIGLAVSRGIVLAHHGEIEVESGGHGASEAPGTRFRVRLPAIEHAPESALAGNAPDRDAGRYRLLVVDDEPDVGETVGAILSVKGHLVEVTESGAEALAALARREFDLVITDLRMPGIDGKTLSERAESVRAGAADRFLFLTGDTLSALAHEFLVVGRRPHLRKPVMPDELRSAVEEAIDSRRRRETAR